MQNLVNLNQIAEPVVVFYHLVQFQVVAAFWVVVACLEFAWSVLEDCYLLKMSNLGILKNSEDIRGTKATF